MKDIIIYTIILLLFLTDSSRTYGETKRSLCNAHAARQWHQFVASAEKKMSSLRKQRSMFLHRLHQRPDQHTMWLWLNRQLLDLEHKRAQLWYQGILDSPMLAMNPQTLSSHLPRLKKAERKRLTKAIIQLRNSTDKYLELLNLHADRLKAQGVQLAKADRLTRFLMRGWFAMRNIFDRIRRTLVNVKVALASVMVLIYTQFLRYCDWKSTKQFETMRTSRVATDDEPAELKGRMQRQYSRLEIQLEEEKMTKSSIIDRSDIKGQLGRIKKAKKYLLMSDEERFWVDQLEWRREAFRMIVEDLAKMRW